MRAGGRSGRSGCSVLVVQVEGKEDEATDDEKERKCDGLPVRMMRSVAQARSVSGEQDQTDDYACQTDVTQNRFLHEILLSREQVQCIV